MSRASPQGGTPELVTFLIVAHNPGEFLGPCLASVCAQTYRPLEIVLVDNASTDGVIPAVVVEFASRVSIHVQRSETNLGPAAGAMFGLPHCRGEFIARLDADDIALPWRIQRQVEYLRYRPDKVAVGGDVLRIAASGDAISVGRSLRTEFLRRRASKWHVGCYHTTLMVRTTTLRQHGYNPTLFAAEDTELIEWVARHGGLGLVPEIVGLYRQHPDSLSARHGALHRHFGNEVIQRISCARTAADRAAIRSADFREVHIDERLQLTPFERTLTFETWSVQRGEWFAAAYFASINGRWRYFATHLFRAATARTAATEMVALFICRTFLPLRSRMANLELWLFVAFALRGTATPTEHSIHLARRLNMARLSAHRMAIAGGFAVLAFFALKARPSVRDVSWFSQDTIYFIDHQNVLCNVAAFGLAALIVEVPLRGSPRGAPRHVGWRAVVIGFVVVVLECLQIFLPQRVFDIGDILAGWLGVFIVSAAFGISGRGRRSLMTEQA